MEAVLHYDVLLEEIFKHLSYSDIQSARRVCRKWRKVGEVIDAKRRCAYQICYSFRLPRFEECLFTNHGFNSIKQLPLLCKTRLPSGTEDLEAVLNRDIKDLYSAPYLMILIEGNNTKVGKKRRWKRAKVINAVRAQLHPKCRVIGIDAHYGVIDGSSSDLITFDFNHSGVFGISCTLLPEFEGVDIEVFHRLTELTVTSDIKGVVLFSSGVSFHGEYLEHPFVQDMVKKLNGDLALGGAQVNDKLVTKLYRTLFSDDTANYFFVNGLPPYNPMFNPQKMSLIGIKFAGPNVLACSIEIEPLTVIDSEYSTKEKIKKELSHIECQLLNFKSNLGFDADCTFNCECLGFLFFNYNRYSVYVKETGNLNAGVELFHKVFPRTKILGLLSHAQYEHNHWPNIEKHLVKLQYDEIDQKPILFPSTASIASFIIVCIKKVSQPVIDVE